MSAIDMEKIYDDFTKMTVGELEAANIKLMAAKDEIIEQQKLLNQVLSQKVANEQARAKWEALSDPEKAALTQYINAYSIDAQGQVGGA